MRGRGARTERQRLLKEELAYHGTCQWRGQSEMQNAIALVLVGAAWSCASPWAGSFETHTSSEPSVEWDPELARGEFLIALTTSEPLARASVRYRVKGGGASREGQTEAYEVYQAGPEPHAVHWWAARLTNVHVDVDSVIESIWTGRTAGGGLLNRRIRLTFLANGSAELRREVTWGRGVIVPDLSVRAGSQRARALEAKNRSRQAALEALWRARASDR